MHAFKFSTCSTCFTCFACHNHTYVAHFISMQAVCFLHFSYTVLRYQHALYAPCLRLISSPTCFVCLMSLCNSTSLVPSANLLFCGLSCLHVFSSHLLNKRKPFAIVQILRLTFFQLQPSKFSGYQISHVTLIEIFQRFSDSKRDFFCSL